MSRDASRSMAIMQSRIHTCSSMSQWARSIIIVPKKWGSRYCKGRALCVTSKKKLTHFADHTVCHSLLTLHATCMRCNMVPCNYKVDKRPCSYQKVWSADVRCLTDHFVSTRNVLIPVTKQLAGWNVSQSTLFCGSWHCIQLNVEVLYFLAPLPAIYRTKLFLPWLTSP